MAEPEEVMVRRVMVAVVAVPVAPAPRPDTFGLGEEQECDREKQGKRTGAPVHHARPLHRGRLTGSLLPAAGARSRCRRPRYRRASSKAVSTALVHVMARVGAGRATVLPDRSVMRRYDICARAWSVSCLVKARRVSVRTLPSEPME